MEKSIIVLANSIKHGKHCIAGRTGSKLNRDGKWVWEWVRVVSNEEGGALSDNQSMCTNPEWQAKGNHPYRIRVLQRIGTDFVKSVPLVNQPENMLVPENFTWKQIGYPSGKGYLKHELENPETLWGDGDKIAFQDIKDGEVVIEQSLYLVRVSNLRLYKNEYDKRRASFIYNKNNYDFAATDPNFDNIININHGLKSNFRNCINGKDSPLESILCISLGENFNGYCYKIVATIF